jgi:hypothetical protein
VAGVLTLAAPIFLITGVQADFPSVGVIQALQPALNGEAAATVDPRVAQVEFIHDNAAGILSYSIGNLLALLAAAYVLLYLFRATKARRPEVPSFIRWFAVLGPLAAGVGLMADDLARLSRAGDFVEGRDRSTAAVEDVLERTVGLSALSTLGTLATAFAFIFIAMNAMRCGLLTRFMGILGVIVGILYVLPLTGLPVVQTFWLLALAPLFAHRWPSGQPPAWLSGKAEPWPTAQEVREQREAQRAAMGPPQDEDGAADEPAEPVQPAHSSSKKRRKRRR